MKSIFTVQHTQSEHHTNGMVGSWTDWNLTELGMQQAERIGIKLKQELDGKKIVLYASDLKGKTLNAMKRQLTTAFSPMRKAVGMNGTD